MAEVATNEEPERIEFEMPQPRCAEVYYAICAMVDQHNRSRQANLKIESKFVTKDWSMRVNLSIFSIITVDAWNVYKGILDKDCPDNENEFYALLAEDLILNTIDSSPSGRTRRQRAGDNVPSPSLIRPDGRSSSGIGAHLTPTKKRRKNKNGDVTNYLCQNWCLECK